MNMTVSNKDKTDLSGKLLVAMPVMNDTRFHQAVILICEHNKDGAMGLVINHIAPEIQFSELVGQLGLLSNIKIDPHKLYLPVMNGGPVETGRGFLLHSDDFKKDETVLIERNMGVTATVEALQEVVQGKGPDQMLFILGYAGWSSGQLDSELQQNSWLLVDSDPELIFEEIPDNMWKAAVNKLGIDPSFLSVEAGRA